MQQMGAEILTNIVQLDKSRGFTRMDNQLMESLAKVDLPAREFRVVMAIARQTVGYQVKSKRLSADDIGADTNMRRDVVSKAISHLLERRIIFRVGGSRGDIGITDPKEWAFYDEKPDRLSETKSSHSDNVVSLGNRASETKTAHSLLYTKKEPPIPLPSEESMSPAENSAEPKADRKAPFGKAQMLASNPHGLEESLIADYLAARKAKRAAVSDRIWSRLNGKLAALKSFGVTPAQGLEIAIDKGWQGFEVEWVLNHIKGNAVAPRGSTASPDFHSGDTSWARDLGPL